VKLAGAAVLEALSGHDSVYDTVIRSIQIGEESDKTFVRIQLSGRSDSKYGMIELTLRDVIEYGFYDSGEWGAHPVEMLKFMALDDGAFYISLDPYDERIERPAEEDNYFVHARSLEAVLILR
jgi:hypothetical protein